MRRRTLDSRIGLVLASTLVAGAAQLGGCSSNDGSLDSTAGATSGGVSQTGGSKTASGGNQAKGGTGATHAGTDPGSGGGPAEGGAPADGGAPTNEGGLSAGGTSTTGGEATGQGGTSAGTFSEPGGAAGAPEGGTSTTGGTGGGAQAGAGGDMGAKSCVYFTPGDEVAEGGAGGAGPENTITVLKNAFGGNYLADGAGKALYTYGADAPGDCNNVPVMNCFLDCLIAWPTFNGEPRVLAPGLDDSMFGAIERPNEPPQTTYKGWPLYYYKNDLAPNDVKGHAVGRIWNLATVILPNIVVIRTGTVRFVADEGGRTLYTSAADTKGTPTAPPVSACTGACLDDFEPFVLIYLAPVSYLLPSDFSYFVRADGAPQIAYKGSPLYLSHADARSTETNGTAVSGWSVAAP